jgi:L-arabinonolactonase
LSDSYDKKMYAYDYNIESGDISNRRTFLSNEAYAGTFDGATVDSEGFIWNAHVFGGRIIRYSPDGQIDRSIEMPVRFVSSVMFGGRDLDILYVTSISQTLSGKPSRDPAAGGLFAIHDLGVRGLPESRFAG